MRHWHHHHDHQHDARSAGDATGGISGERGPEQGGRGRRGPRGRQGPRDLDRGELGFGRHGHGGPGPFGGRGGRTRRGDVRFALLAALQDGPAHGYELIQRLEERTGGRWKPSPGSVYPTLQLLEEAGLVTGGQQDDKRVYTISEAGAAALQERLADGTPPWMSPGEGGDLRQAVGQLVMAAKQVGMAGNAEHVQQATAIITEARRKLYQLLAEA